MSKPHQDCPPDWHCPQTTGAVGDEVVGGDGGGGAGLPRRRRPTESAWIEDGERARSEAAVVFFVVGGLARRRSLLKSARVERGEKMRARMRMPGLYWSECVFMISLFLWCCCCSCFFCEFDPRQRSTMCCVLSKPVWYKYCVYYLIGRYRTILWSWGFWNEISATESVIILTIMTTYGRSLPDWFTLWFTIPHIIWRSRLRLYCLA